MLITKKLFFILIILSIHLQLNSADAKTSADAKAQREAELQNIGQDLEKMHGMHEIPSIFAKYKAKLENIIKELSTQNDITPDQLEHYKNLINAIAPICSRYARCSCEYGKGSDTIGVELIIRAKQVYNTVYNAKLAAAVNLALASQEEFADPLKTLISQYAA